VSNSTYWEHIEHVFPEGSGYDNTKGDYLKIKCWECGTVNTLVILIGGSVHLRARPVCIVCGNDFDCGSDVLNAIKSGAPKIEKQSKKTQRETPPERVETTEDDDVIDPSTITLARGDVET
jgi:hypothetical protein